MKRLLVALFVVSALLLALPVSLFMLWLLFGLHVGVVLILASVYSVPGGLILFAVGLLIVEIL